MSWLKAPASPDEEARKDAERSAIQQVVRTLVAAETVTANDKVIRDEVLTASAGIVEESKELTSSEKGGLWQVRIVARVVDRRVTERLEKIKVPVQAGKIDGKQVANQILAEIEAERNTVRWLTHELKGYPWGCIRLELAEFQELGNERTDKEITILLKIKRWVDLDSYKKVAASLDETLEHLAIQPPVPFTQHVTGHSMSDLKFPPFTGQRRTGIAVITAIRGKNPIELSGRYFVVHQDAREVFKKLVAGVSRKIQLILRDEGGKALKECELNLPFSFNSSVPLLGSPLDSNGYGLRPSLRAGQYDFWPEESVYSQDSYRLTLPIALFAKVAKYEISSVSR